MTLYPAGKSLQSSALKRRLHGSGLEAAVRAAKARRARTPPSPAILEANQGCRPIHTFNGKLPDNVKEKGTICEETRINSFAESFVHEHKFERRVGQVEAVKSGLARIVWPTPSIELKVMWIPATSLIKSFSCDKPDPILHTEVIDGECYAMVGMHLASKLYENWLWATFEVKDERTNPLRCIWFGPCRDTWGTTPEISNGGPTDATALTPALLKLMSSAGLGDQLRNYRLVGTQLNFVDDKQNPTFLGNSVIEGEGVGMLQNRSSCITCHAYSEISPTGQEIDFVKLGIDNPGVIGRYVQPNPGWMNRGFVWSLTAVCPAAPGDDDARCK